MVKKDENTRRASPSNLYERCCIVPARGLGRAFQGSGKGKLEPHRWVAPAAPQWAGGLAAYPQELLPTSAARLFQRFDALCAIPEIQSKAKVQARLWAFSSHDTFSTFNFTFITFSSSCTDLFDNVEQVTLRWPLSTQPRSPLIVVILTRSSEGMESLPSALQNIFRASLTVLSPCVVFQDANRAISAFPGPIL